MSQIDLYDESMQAAIKALREITEEDILSGVNDHDLRRFLIARQMDVKKAKEMLADYVEWRKKDKIDSMPPMGSPTNPHLYSLRGFDVVKDLDPNFDAPNFPPFLKYCGGGCYHKRDKEGLPIFIERLGRYDAKKLAAKSQPEAFVDHHVRQSEFVFSTLMKEASERAGKVIEKQTVIFDCAGMGMHQFHMPAFAFLRALADHDSKYYPERLGRLFLVNAPGLFTKVWVMVKKWLDKGVIDKVHILGADAKDVLLQHIDADCLPAFLGGSCTCSHMVTGCVPVFAQLGGIVASDDDNSLDFTGQLKDPRDPHLYEISVPMEELVVSNQPFIAYKFKSQKRPVQFEVRHRKFGADDEVPVVEGSVVNSHDNPVTGRIPAEPGVYSFYWTKVSRGGISGINLTTVQVEYSVDVEFETLQSPGATNGTVNLENGAAVRVSEDNDDDEFVDAE
ncbi:hypothetical protein HDU97_003885 [Phlyctochytrium planicorne]|nr:hypothetical protein HDU97_003885 [Phlyctochytrium planicorne]